MCTQTVGQQSSQCTRLHVHVTRKQTLTTIHGIVGRAGLSCHLEQIHCAFNWKSGTLTCMELTPQDFALPRISYLTH